MEIDSDLAAKMQALAAREAEIQREKEEVRLAAKLELAEIDKSLERMREELSALEDKREQVARFLGYPSRHDTIRIGHGELKELCFEALRAIKRPARASEVREWIESHHPGVRTNSVPSTLSRQFEYGTLSRDSAGQYSLM